MYRLHPSRSYIGPATGGEDLLGLSAGLNPPGLASDPTRNTTTGLWEFSGAADNIIHVEWQVSHKSDLSSDFEPHIHLLWITAASGLNQRWQLELNYAGINQNLAAAYGSFAYDETITVANANDADKHTIHYFPSLDISGLTLSALVTGRLTRLANSDAVDDDTNAVALGSLDAHYRSVRLGADL